MYVRVRSLNADSCQAAGRLISFVFHTVSSIYPLPVEEGGGWGWGVPEVLLPWRAEPDTRGPIPTEEAFIIRPSRRQRTSHYFFCCSKLIWLSQESQRARGWIQFGSAQTNVESNKIFAPVTQVKNNFAGRSTAAWSFRSPWLNLPWFIRLRCSSLIGTLWSDMSRFPSHASFNSPCHSMGSSYYFLLPSEEGVFYIFIYLFSASRMTTFILA